MNLTQSVARYLVSFDGHDVDEGETLHWVIKRLSESPLSELHTEYNALSMQKLWVNPLLDAFHDELLGRLIDETTFSISTSWRSVQEWLANPFVNLELGIEEKYPVINPEGGYIRRDDPTLSSFALLNDSFTNEDEEILLRLLLDPVTTATVEIQGEQIRIIGLNQTQLIPSQGGQVIQSPVSTREDPEYRLTKRLYQGVKDRNPGVIDLGAPRLINQLVDLDEAYRIVADGGVNLEGDLLLSAQKEEEED